MISLLTFQFLCFVSEKYRVSSPERYITFRVKNDNNLSQFQAELESLDWHDVLQSTDSSEAYKLFIDKYTSAYNRSFPLKKVLIRKSRIGKTWLTKGLMRSIRKKNNLYKHFLNDPNQHMEFKYKQYRNKLIPSVLPRVYILRAKFNSIRMISKALGCISIFQLLPGHLPDKMKIACVIPLCKSSAHNVLTNYRPVSILPAFSKIFEKITYKRLLAFLYRRKILSDT